YRNILERKADGAPVDIRNLAKLFPTMLEDISKLYTGFRGPVILIGHAPNTNLICALRPNYFSLPCPASSKVEHVAFKAAFAAFAGRHSQFQFVDPLDAICPAAECRMTNSAGHSLYVDENHLSIFGARLIVPKIIEMLRGDLTVQSIDLRRAG
ncbi:SGNH hydrolase domain-containing protein, partial [Mesorhizobium sp. M4B.F.Ca.ET.089.01.1.1]